MTQSYTGQMGQLRASMLVPAQPLFDEGGTPYSAAYGDVYHSAEGGIAQAQHVFLRGNGLPGRWRGRRSFTILETGFGFGLSFLATLQAWREDPGHCERLHFVSVEKHPFSVADLSFVLKKYAELKGQELVAHWPMLVPGMHRLEFAGGNVALTLFFGDIAEGLPQLSLAADAIYLDGFAPAKNPAMWEPRLLRHLGRLAAPGATVATWSVAASVRDALEGAGFRVEKTGGFGTKKEMLIGHSVRTRHVEKVSFESRKAMIVGAGVAGAAVAERLSARGWEVKVLERHARAAEEASGNPAGVFHPVVSPDDSLFARCTRASFLFLLNHWKNLAGLEWNRCGVLQLARDAGELASQRRAIATLGYPEAYAQLRDGGIWFPEGGWVKPRSLVEGLLSRFPVERLFGREVEKLSFNGEWHAIDAKGATIASAPVVVLANAADALRLSPQPQVRLQRIRGQLTLAPAIAGLEHVVLRGGMVIPGIDGRSVIGASYDIGDEDASVRVDSHEGNLARLEQILPGASKGLDAAKLEGRVAFRATVRDRLPLIGPLGDGLFAAFAYGSRGLLWCGLAGEIIASILEGEPQPVERKLAAAMAPGRFLLRQKRKSPTAGRA
jgi:tRNA 5-methylaminomethyl-2-thiouridine biosynthesis bifunctional protein